jgi:hypothetical protein
MYQIVNKMSVKILPFLVFFMNLLKKRTPLTIVAKDVRNQFVKFGYI